MFLSGLQHKDQQPQPRTGAHRSKLLISNMFLNGDRLLAELEDSLTRLRDVTAQAQQTSLDLNAARDLSRSGEKQRDLIKLKAQEAVKQ